MLRAISFLRKESICSFTGHKNHIFYNDIKSSAIAFEAGINV